MSHDGDLFALVSAVLTRDRSAAAQIIFTMTRKELQGTLVAMLGELVAAIEAGNHEAGVTPDEFLDTWRRLLVDEGRM